MHVHTQKAISMQYPRYIYTYMLYNKLQHYTVWHCGYCVCVQCTHHMMLTSNILQISYLVQRLRSPATVPFDSWNLSPKDPKLWSWHGRMAWLRKSGPNLRVSDKPSLKTLDAQSMFIEIESPVSHKTTLGSVFISSHFNTSVGWNTCYSTMVDCRKGGKRKPGVFVSACLGTWHQQDH